jgi:DnaJ-class molecular chaperone
MGVDKGLYSLLDVSPDVNEHDLRKAFQDKAMRLHPDKNRNDPRATEKFQEVKEAWEILKDPRTRRLYDQYGLQGVRQAATSYEPREPRPRTQDLHRKVSVSLEDLYNGKELSVDANHDVFCIECSGSGCLKGKNATKCRNCGGRGRLVQMYQIGPVVTQQLVPCHSCHGTGETIDPKFACRKCKGKKTVTERKSITVHVTPGMSDGERIVFQGAADEAPGADPGDLVVVLEQKKHDRFQRKADDLLTMKQITLAQALFGTTFVLKHLDGRNLVVTSAPGEVLLPDTVKVILNEGMPHRGDAYQKGRLFVKFEVIFPRASELTPELKAAVLTALPPPDEAAGIDPGDENTYQVSMKDSEMKHFEQASDRRETRREAYRGDEDEETGWQQTGSCQPM